MVTEAAVGEVVAAVVAVVVVMDVAVEVVVVVAALIEIPFFVTIERFSKTAYSVAITSRSL
jgi:hypothetical protein